MISNARQPTPHLNRLTLFRRNEHAVMYEMIRHIWYMIYNTYISLHRNEHAVYYEHNGTAADFFFIYSLEPESRTSISGATMGATNHSFNQSNVSRSSLFTRSLFGGLCTNCQCIILCACDWSVNVFLILFILLKFLCYYYLIIDSYNGSWTWSWRCGRNDWSSW